ncbi:MAG TPA: enolase C-terminal domain-like protein [Phycisphaerae bacterium]|nr:enolase C-terminal domain-like protein [Phycisphaerae bacterium]
MRIDRSTTNFEREPMAAPFGFKGGYLTEMWQSVVGLHTRGGLDSVGLGSQSILWCDARVFADNSEAAGNCAMFQLTDFAARKAREIDWNIPSDLLDRLLPATYEHGKTLTGRPDLRMTFALNALVPVDNAAWLLHAADRGIKTFDDLLPADDRPALSVRQQKVALVPLMSYGVPVEKIIQAADEGCCVLKIKIGADPDHDGNLDRMLEWDKARLSAIHRAIGDRTTPHTTNGRIAYYLDANGRYDTLDRLHRLLDHADKIGALDRIILLEEPFPEEVKVDVAKVPVRIAADESAHTDKDALERISLGYRAIALKPIAKTLSMTLRIIQTARRHGIACLCADLTVNPILVDWNKTVAARLPAVPGMQIGMLETNGHQNYRNWPQMMKYHPCCGASWATFKQGVFNLDDDFYRRSGGIFETSAHYRELVTPPTPKT